VRLKATLLALPPVAVYDRKLGAGRYCPPVNDWLFSAKEHFELTPVHAPQLLNRLRCIVFGLFTPRPGFASIVAKAFSPCAKYFLATILAFS